MTSKSPKAKKPIQGGPTFSIGHRVFRLVWIMTWRVCCSWTPRQFASWRRFILRMFGANVANTADVRGRALIWYPPNLTLEDDVLIAERVNLYNVSEIVIHKGSIVSQGAFLCTASHDINSVDFPLSSHSISVGRYCWIAAEAFVGPGVTIDNGAVLGARAAAFKDLSAWHVYGGCPARCISQRKVFDASDFAK